MKKIVTTLLIAGLTGLGFSQAPEESISTFKMANVRVSPLNLKYLNNTQDINTPAIARELQHKAADFDVSKMPGYTNRATLPIEVLFKASNGKLLAAYNTKGEILYTYENFENVVLPASIREMSTFRENAGWQMKENRYICIYSNDKVVKQRYKIDLTDGDSKKQLVINLNE